MPAVHLAAAIDLCDSPLESVPKQKKGKSTVKTRKVSYKKALAASRMPLPELQEAPKAPVQIPIQPEPIPQPVAVEQQNTEQMYDLTGDVELTAMHSSAPLFQKEALPKPTIIVKQHNMSQEFDYDFESITINVKINGKISKFVHKSVDVRFYDLFKIIAEQQKVPIDNLFIFDEKEKRILPDETPKDVAHKISAIYSKTQIKSLAFYGTNC